MEQTQLICQGHIDQNLNQQELSSLFMTHCLDMMNSSVKFHESTCMRYRLEFMAWTLLHYYSTWNLV